MITGIKKLLQQADRIIWGPWLIFLLLGTGCYLMLSLRFLPLKNLPAALRRVFLPESRKGTEGRGVSSFSSLTTELAATIGTGNIVGVATAMVLGGPGAPVSYTHLRAHETGRNLVCRLLLEKKKTNKKKK